MANRYPEIQTRKLYDIEGEVYELVDMRVTSVESPNDFVTTAFFKSKNENSKIPFFEERIETILLQPHIYKRIYNNRLNNRIRK